MAFVVRSSREIKLNMKQVTDIGPGEYDNNSGCGSSNNSGKGGNGVVYSKSKKYFTNHSTPMIIPFNSTSQRNCTTYVCKDNFPGPGSYNRFILCDDSGGNSNIYNNNNNCSSCKHMSKYASHKHIGFLTNAKRFDNNDVNDGDGVPGPGQYDTTSSFTVTSSCANNNNKRGFFISKSKAQHDNNTNKAKRVVSIPSKENIGYYLTNGEPVLVNNTNNVSTTETKFSGVKDDCVGPGRYNVNTSWEKNVIKWKRNVKVNKSSTQKNFEMFQLQRDNMKSKSFLSNSCDNNNTSNNNNSNHLLKSKKVIFKQIKLHRKKYIDNLTDTNSNILTELKYTDTPGPGFYERDDTQHKINYFEHKSPIQQFGSVSPKLHSQPSNTNIGPGSYFKQPNYHHNTTTTTNTNANTAYIHQRILHKTNMNALSSSASEHEIPILLEHIRNKHKPSSIGPGSYNITQPLIRKEVSNITQFGSLAERFNNKHSNSSEQTPAPGAYDPDHSGKATFTFPRKVIEHEHKRIQPYKDDTPPVGTYNPGVVTSIQYNVNSKVNPYKCKLSPFNGSDVRFSHNAMLVNRSGVSVGPGEYDVPSEFDLIRKRKGFRFGKGKEREQKKEVKNKEMPGPGEYDMSVSCNWKKKSFNVLFI